MSDMEITEIPESKGTTLIEVLVNEDSMAAFIKLTKQGEDVEPITKGQLMEALQANRITYGIKESSVEKLAARPIYNIKIEVAKGLAPVSGEDGSIICYVKKDSEYHPEYSLDGNVDYKNLDYFQLVKQGQVLCDIQKETDGTEGINVYGGMIPTRNGKPPFIPNGKNTVLAENDTKLIAACDGVIRYVRDVIDVNDVFRITSNVDQLTGNINFSGDVNVEGDICDGFTVKTGGNLVVKGVVEDAAIEASGNVHISKGINGGGDMSIYVGGDLRCKYIENATLYVEGNIAADYIIESRITCMGNIELLGGKELILGGDIKVFGELTAKDIGNEKERNTKIEVLGQKIFDVEGIEKLKLEIQQDNEQAVQLVDTAAKLNQLIKAGAGGDYMDQYSQVKRQAVALKEKIDFKNKQLQKLENEWTMIYPGAVNCKRKMYQGVRINFGEERFTFNFDNIEHCRIFWADGQIIQGTL